MTSLSAVTQIWNRAALEAGGPGAREGDRALADALRAHSLVTTGGLAQCVATLSHAEVNAAAAGLRYYGFADAAAALRRAADAGADEAQTMAYRRSIDDEGLTSAFQARLAASPEAFAPFEGEK
jgi:hypothetical protein